MTSLPIVGGVHAPDDKWPGDAIHGWEWPVEWGWCVEFRDGSIAYYPSWEVIPNRILQLQERGSYREAEVTVVSWGDGGE